MDFDPREFLRDAGIQEPHTTDYAREFRNHYIAKNMLMHLDRDWLKDMNITLVGHALSILTHVKIMKMTTIKEEAGATESTLVKNVLKKMEEMEANFKEMQDSIMELKLKIGLINVGDSAAELLGETEKSNTALSDLELSKSESTMEFSPACPSSCRPKIVKLWKPVTADGKETYQKLKKPHIRSVVKEDGEGPENSRILEKDQHSLSDDFSSDSEKNLDDQNVDYMIKEEFLELELPEIFYKDELSASIKIQEAETNYYSNEYKNNLMGKHSVTAENIATVENASGQQTPATCDQDVQAERRGIRKSKYVVSHKYKKTWCKFCELEIVSKHFSRHLQNKHRTEAQVIELCRLGKASSCADKNRDSKKKEKRLQLLTIIRNEGNLQAGMRGKIIPKRRGVSGEPVSEVTHAMCQRCKSFFKKEYLRRHQKRCDFYH